MGFMGLGLPGFTRLRADARESVGGWLCSEGYGQSFGPAFSGGRDGEGEGKGSSFRI